MSSRGSGRGPSPCIDFVNLSDILTNNRSDAISGLPEKDMIVQPSLTKTGLRLSQQVHPDGVRERLVARFQRPMQDVGL